MEFLGYKRANGTFGTRNHVLVISSVACANGVVEAIGRALPEVVTVTHGYGCGTGPQDLSVSYRTLTGLINHPNVGAALVIGLGCETLGTAMIMSSIQDKPAECLVIQESGGSAATTKKGIEIAEKFLKTIDKQKRVPTPVSELVVGPLYPQFSGTTTASIYDGVEAALQELSWQPGLHRIEKYHDHPAWVEAIAESIRNYRAQYGTAEKLIFSLHGIPQRYVRQGDPYQQQCEESVRAVVQSLGLSEGEWLLTYQSRVGREPWLQPYTDITLEELAKSGVRHVQVLCPGFAVDCLETLEEIAMQNRELFEEAGGDKLEYIPALNDSDAHARLMEQLVEEALDRGQSKY